MKMRLLLTSLLLSAIMGMQAAETPPVTLSCSTSSDFSKWTTLSSSSRLWTFSSSQSAAESYASWLDDTNDYWLISPSVTLEAGVKYDVTYNVKVQSTSASYSVKFTAGQGNTTEAQTHELYSNTSFIGANTYFNDYSYTFEPETSGEYNFAIWNGSTTPNSIYLKYIKIEAQVPLPGSATDVTVTPDANGALGATVAWTWPSLTSKGGELTSITGAKIYRTNSSWGSASESNLIATVPFADAQPGAAASWHDGTLTTAGNYYYFVKPYNEYGDSPSTVAASGKTDWIGTDTPNAFTPTATLADDAQSVSLNWSVTGKNGGIIDPAQISYKIERVGSLSGTTVLETNWQGELPYVDQLTAYDKYVYKVYFITGGTTSSANNAVAVTGGPALQPPYAEDFATTSHGDVWTFVSNITRNWTVSSSKLDFWATSGNSVNAWAITPPLALKAGKAYQLTFNAYKQTTATEDRTLSVAVAQNKTLEAMNEATLLLTEMFQTATTAYQKIVTVAQDGTYYLGFNIKYESKNSNDAYIDDIKLEEVAVAPQAATDLAIIPDAAGALTAVVKWTNPTLDNTGSPLAAIDKAELYRGDELINTYENPAPGAEMSADETYAEPGTYTYSVVCYLGDCASEMATATSPWVGVDIPAAPAEVTLQRNNDGSATLTWLAPKGKQGGYVGALTYTVTNLVNNEEVASALADTVLAIPAPDALAIYSYSVAATNSQGTGDAATSNSVLLGSGIELPYQPTINADALALWSLPANEEGKVWKFDSSKGGLYSGYSTGLWAFTPPLSAQKGTIKLTVAGTAYSSRYQETLEVGLYTVAEIGAEPLKLDTVVFKNNYPSDNTFTFDYNLPKGGTYYIGYHLITNDVWGCTITKTDVEQTLAIMPSGPVAVEDITLTAGEKGDLTASLAWTYPSLAENGEQLEAIDSAAIMRNGDLIATLPAALPGSACQYADTVEAPGIYHYSLITYSEGCASQPALTDTLWIGRDTLPAVANAALAIEEDSLVVSFDAVTSGIHGGYIPADSVAYVVFDDLNQQPVDTVAASPVAFPIPELYSRYSFTIFAIAGEEKSEGASTNAIVCGTSVALDYANTFVTDADAAVMELRPNASGENWKFVEKDGDHQRFFSSVDNAELVTPPFLAQEGTVKASALARCFGALYPETFVVRLYAQGQDDAIATDTIVADGAGFVSYSPVDFAIPATGIYRVGYTVEKKSIQAYIDGIKIEQTVIISDEVSAPVTNATATAANWGALRATVAWDTPTLNTEGDELHHLVAVKVYRGDALIDSIFEPTPGARLSATDSTIVVPGFYEYSIVAVTDKHVSDTVKVASDWVGLDTATAPVATVTANGDGTATLTIEHGQKGINGGYVGEVRSRIVSSVNGQLTDNTDNTEIELPEPESLDVFSFTVWAFGENNVMSDSCTTASIAMGKAVLLPHAFDFAREEIFMIWDMGAWAYDAETKSVATSQASDLVTPPFLAKEGEVALDFHAAPQGAAATFEFTLLNAEMQPVSDPVEVAITDATNSQHTAIVAVPAHEGDEAYRLAINAKDGASISAAELRQHSVNSIAAAGADSGFAYDAATATLTAHGTVRIFAASGMLLRTIDVNGAVSLSHLPAGVYVVTCGSHSLKIVK